MSDTKWLAFVTPKSYNSAKVKLQDSEQFKDIEIIGTADIYINQMCGWTEDECDNVCYLVEREFFNKKEFVFSKGVFNE